MQPKYSKFLALLLILTLIGCGTSGVRDSQPQQQVDNDLLLQAEKLVAIGDSARAADLYRQLAAALQSPQKELYLILAAENYFSAGNLEAASEIIATVDTKQADLDFRKRLLSAELALAQDQPETAFSLLDQPLTAELDPATRMRYHKARAETFRLLGNILESAAELSEIDPLLQELAPRLDNQFAIIETLAVLTDTALDLLKPYPPGILGGWMELTRIIKAHAGDTQALQPLLDEWHTLFPEHPAMPELLNGYFDQLKAQYRKARHIAVLLPKTGPYGKPADALRDGILAAYYNQPPAERPQLVFYDNSNSAETWPLYQQAVDSGADMVIGPLVKEAVEQFTRAGELPIPVLALNQVPPEVAQPMDLYQFGLSPEDEAQQVAERAWTDGHTRAAVLKPSDNWGERILNAFRDRWERLGGSLVEFQTYNPSENDFSETIRALLNLDESEARRQDMQRLLGKQLEFEPRRRRDAGFVFLVARPQNARQIRPQLQFHHAADMPVYSTSHIYTGQPDPISDQDIEGLIFPDIPWLLETDSSDPLSRENLAGYLPPDASSYYRLYAMGIDSYRLIPHLARLQTNSREMFEGVTGNLYLDDIRHIHRQLVWARITNATPEVLGYTPRMDIGYGSGRAIDNQMPGEREALGSPESETPPEASTQPAD
jgi:hypothetical protein